MKPVTEDLVYTLSSSLSASEKYSPQQAKSNTIYYWLVDHTANRCILLHFYILYIDMQLYYSLILAVK